MSTRDYRLTVRIDIDRQSLNDFAAKLSRALERSIGQSLKAMEKIKVGGAPAKMAVDEKLLTKLDKLSISISALIATMDRVGRRLRRVAKAQKRKKETKKPDEGELPSWKEIIQAIKESSFKPLSKAVAIGMLIYDVVKRIAQRAIEFAGNFRTALKLLETSIALFLRPILEVIGILLRPFLLLMLRVAVIWNKWMGPVLSKLAKGEPLTVGGTIAGGVGGFILGRAGGQLAGQVVGGLAGQVLGGTAGRLIGGAVGALGGPVGMIIGMTVGGMIGSWLGDILSKEETWKGITDAISGTGNWLWEKLSEIGGSILGAFEFVGNWFQENFGPIIAGIGGAWDFVVNWFSENFGNVGVMLGGAWETLVGWVSDNFGGIGEALGGAWSHLVDWVSDHFGGIGATLGGAWGGFVDWVTEKFGGIGSSLGGAWRGFTDWVKEKFGGIGSSLGGAWNHFTNWIKDNLGSIGSDLGREWNRFVDWVKDNFGRISEKVGEGWNTFVDFLTGIGNAISDKLKPVWDEIVNFFSRLGSILGKLLSGDFVGAATEVAGLLGIQVPEWLRGRGQFGLNVLTPGSYFLEAGEIVLSRHDVMRLVSMMASGNKATNVTVTVNVAGPVYGISDLEERIKRVVESSVGNILYDTLRRGVR